MRLQFVIIGLLVVLMASNLRAQELCVVKGRVLDDATKDPIPGVNIIVRGEKRGTTTDTAGYFRLGLPDRQKRIIVFSHVGYQKVNRLVSFDTTSDIRFRIFLTPDTLKLPEVVVTGVKRIVITEAAERRALFTISGEEFEKLGEDDMGRALNYFFPFQIKSRISRYSNPSEEFTLYVNGEPKSTEYLEDIDPYTVIKVLLWDMVGIDRNVGLDGKGKGLGGIDLFPLGMPLRVGKYVIAIETKQ